MKNDSKKLLPWSKTDIVKNVITYVANYVILLGLFLLAIYANSALLDGANLKDYLVEVRKLLFIAVTIGVMIIVMAVYFFFEDRNFLKNAVNSEMLFLIVELGLIIAHAVGVGISRYLRPLTLVTILTLFLTNRRSAVFMSVFFFVLTIMFEFITTPTMLMTDYVGLILGFGSSIVSVYYFEKVYSRIKLLFRSVIISLPIIALAAVEILSGKEELIWQSLVCSLCSGPFAVACCIILLPLFEVLFKRVSIFRLEELTNHKSKLISRMIKEAPGTFNHSMMVSNIAEACASAIEEDALLARTCAYYHDIGKLRRPEYFGENQAGGQNLHDDLTPELSTNIIKSHAKDGYELILKHRLPKVIADVCVQHHGTMPILYFYDKAKKFTDGEVDVKQYCYTGPKPQTKIAAIIMIADGCEAATRTVKDRSRENVKKVVRNIVNERMQMGQFDECEITIKELNIIIHTIVNNFTGIYHSRVEYPKVNLSGLEPSEQDE